MKFVLILTVALTVCAQAVPQFNNFGLGNSGVKGIFRQDQSRTNTENGNPLKDLIRSVLPLPSKFNQHRRPNENGRQPEPDNRRNAGQCWDPMSRTYRDWPNTQLPNQYTSHDQFYNDNFPRRDNNYNPPMNQHSNYGNYWDGYHQTSYGHGPHDHGHQRPHDHGHQRPHDHGHQRPHDHGHQRPHDHGHGHGHGHGHDNGSPHNHGYGYGSAHDHAYNRPPHYHGNGRPELPPRPPHREHHENVYELEICEEPSTENVLSKNMETTTIDSGSAVINLPDSSSPQIPSIATAVKPEDSRNTETGTQSGISSPVQTTTEFDWNNYFIGASADNTGGIGAIDIRAGGITAV